MSDDSNSKNDPDAALNGAEAAIANRYFDQETVEIEEEGLFARNIDGQLVRMGSPTEKQYGEDVTIKIDGQEVTVKRAVPIANAQGNIITDAEGRTTPRFTTIYDAARELFVKKPGDVNPIPVLCHRDHMTPAGVCRICAVEITRVDGGKRRTGAKLVPACQHRVEPGMEVQTIESADDPAARDRIRAAVGVLLELLAADTEYGSSADSEIPNEVSALADRFGVISPRFDARPKTLSADESSPLIKVDHNSCILCDRCVRACDEVKHNHVIGRTGKGYTTRIGFDLDAPMGTSSCVSCGECMFSCPTDALTFRQQVEREIPAGGIPVSATDLKRIPIFASVPYKFLQFNAGSVIRRQLNPGDLLCEEGKPGATAYLLLDGEFEVSIQTSLSQVDKKPPVGWRRVLGRVTSGLAAAADELGQRIRNDSGRALSYQKRTKILTPEDVIIGEMTCMSHYPRSATVRAHTRAEVLEIRRNVLYMLQRNEAARRMLDDVYRERALENHLREVDIFRSLDEQQRKECVKFLSDEEKVDLVRLDPGQLIFRQGEPADHFYMVRLGFVRVTQRYMGEERVLNYLGPGKYFGEIGFLSEIRDLLTEHVAGFEGVRTATCRALDDVELVRIRGEYFRELIKRYPALVKPLAERASELIEENDSARRMLEKPLNDFLDEGLYNAQKLLVLDLEACTRCDECTKACADTHGGITRLIREGLRFDKYLVASSCRSCLDPYCLVGCPVDAIHREGSSEIRIQPHCIGCGLCARNCPYGNINMHGFSDEREDPENPGQMRPFIQQKATTCDLCRGIVGENEDPSCVYACPHNAAFRLSGRQLLDSVSTVASVASVDEHHSG